MVASVASSVVNPIDDPDTPHHYTAKTYLRVSQVGFVIMRKLQHDEGTAGGSNFDLACGNGLAIQVRQLIVLTQDQLTAV